MQSRGDFVTPESLISKLNRSSNFLSSTLSFLSIAAYKEEEDKCNRRRGLVGLASKE
jgi:hypothetical protein